MKALIAFVIITAFAFCTPFTDSMMRVVAYKKGTTIYLPNGKCFGFMDGDFGTQAIYSYGSFGKVVAWYKSGVIYDRNGKRAGALNYMLPDPLCAEQMEPNRPIHQNPGVPPYLF